MRTLTSAEAKRIEYDILCEFDQICRNKGLRYYLAYGTCLGAMRHGGFIPWDDDVDVCMPRDDYERLWSLWQQGEIETRYKLTSYRTGDSYSPFFKLVDTSTLVHEAYIHPKWTIGLWIDIFPMEHVATSVEQDAAYLSNLKRAAALRRKLSFVIGDPSAGATPVARLAKRIVSPFANRMNPLIIAEQIDALSKQAGQTGKTPDAYIDFIWTVNGTPPILLEADLFPTAPIMFEGRQFPAPKHVERYLELCYGDWRQLPPENERHAHFAEACALD